MDELPSDFDTIVVGTGLPESILAAAHARNGRSVLHIDRFESYGGMWSTFNFDGLENWLRLSENPEGTSPGDSDSVTENVLNNGEKVIGCVYNDKIYKNFKKYEYLNDDLHDSKSESAKSGDQTECSEFAPSSEEKTEAETELSVTSGQDCEGHETDTDVIKDEVTADVSAGENDIVATAKPETVLPKTETSAPDTNWSMTKIRSLYRKFNLDLAPKMLFSRGELVDLLITSNIARYAEFKSVTRVLTYLDGKLEPVPCSRSDVFTTKNVSIVEKRMLMKLLTFCLAYEENGDEYRDFERKTFAEFLKSKKLTPNVQHYVLHAIAMLPESGSTLEGLENTKRFLNSLGRYGNTPFLWPLYGSGELPQCFCRLCAVFGGVYCLKRGVESIIVNENNECCGIVSNGKRLNCKWLVMEANFAPLSWIPSDSEHSDVSRAILLTDRSILPLDKEQLTLLRLPAKDGLKEPTWVVELGSASMACPPGLFVVHLTCKTSIDAESDLESAVNLLFERSIPDDGCDQSGKPRVMWCLYFNQTDNSEYDFRSVSSCPSNVTLTAGPSGLIDFDDAVHKAKAAFQQSFPEEEFLPRAPDPEEIVIEGAEEVSSVTQPNDEAVVESEALGDLETAVAAAEISNQDTCCEPDLTMLKEE